MFRLLKCYVIAVLLATSTLEAGSARGGSVPPAGDRPQACQVAVLRNGFTLQYLRREAAGAATRLWLCGDEQAGYVEIPSEQIERFEQMENTVPLTPAPAIAPPRTAGGMRPIEDSLKKVITGAAIRHQIDPDFVTSVVKAESGFNAKAVSSKGARGLMQLMPQTAVSLGVKNAFDAAANVEGGTRYLRQLLDQYDGDSAKALAAYNAGAQRVEQYGGIPPYRETRAYVTRVIDDYNSKKLAQQADSRAAVK